MKKMDIDRLFRLNGVEKDLYLFALTTEKILDEGYMYFSYHFRHKFPEFMKTLGKEYNKSTVSKGVGALVKKGYLRRGEHRGDYFIDYTIKKQ